MYINCNCYIIQVEPFASLASLPHLNIPRLLLNRELVGPFRHRRKRSTDVALTGDLEECVRELAEISEWTRDLETLVKGEPGISLPPPPSPTPPAPSGLPLPLVVDHVIQWILFIAATLGHYGHYTGVAFPQA